MSQQINLFNPVFRKPVFSLTSADAMLYGVGIVIAVAALYSAYLSYRLQVVRRAAAAVAQQYQDETARRDQLQAAQTQHKPDAALTTEVAALEAKLAARQQIVEILNSGALGTTGGFSEYMRAFSRQTVSGLWLTGFDIKSDGLSIAGRTLSPDLLPDYLKRLNQEPALQGKQFAALQISRPGADTTAATATPAAAVTTAPAVAATTASSTPPAAGASSGQKSPPLPRFLEFTISTSETAEGAAPLPAPGTTSAAAPAQTTGIGAPQ